MFAGFFENGPVHVALAAGALSALVAGVVGVFVVLRGQSFAGHALADLGTLGGSGAFLLGISPLWGFVGVGAAVAGAMELLGVHRRRGRDVATGVVLGGALGVAALLLYLDATSSTTTGATITVLFGSLFAASPGEVPAIAGLAGAGILAVAVLYRPLLLTSVHPDLATVRGIPTRAVAVGFLVLVGVTVSLTSMVVGTILTPALLIGPAATALRLTKRTPVAMVLSGVIGLVATWAGVALSYASYDWPPAHDGWPISFFIVAIVLVTYLGAELVPRRSRATAPGAVDASGAVGGA